MDFNKLRGLAGKISPENNLQGEKKLRRGGNGKTGSEVRD